MKNPHGQGAGNETEHVCADGIAANYCRKPYAKRNVATLVKRGGNLEKWRRYERRTCVQKIKFRIGLENVNCVCMFYLQVDVFIHKRTARVKYKIVHKTSCFQADIDR